MAATMAPTKRLTWSIIRCLSRSSSFSPEYESGGAFDVINPATGAKIAQLPNETADQVVNKFELLQAGQKRWKAVPVSERKEILENFNRLLLSKTDSLAKVLTSEMGKPIAQARQEVRATVERIKFYLENYDKVMAEQTVHATSRLKEKVVYEPLGVVANISAWNYPYFVSANVFAAALLTGNAVLYKPSEYASLTGQEITRLLYEAGIPENVFSMATGKASTGAAVVSLRGLRGVFFTGSHKTGLAVAQTAASNLVKVQLELGGKDPVYVRKDVPNLATAAASIADGAFYNCGQSCCSVERIYVDRTIYNQFVEHFVTTVKSFRVGDPLDRSTYIGPVARQAQLSFLAGQVTDALQKGAAMALGADPVATNPSARGFYFPPTVRDVVSSDTVDKPPLTFHMLQVLVDVNHSMSIMQEESFGPVIGIQAVDGDSDAVALMKDTSYGLTASVFCKSSSTAEDILGELDVGTGYWNCCDRVSPRLPWSGRKASGLGATLGIDGFRSFVQPKGIFLQSLNEDTK